MGIWLRASPNADEHPASKKCHFRAGGGRDFFKVGGTRVQDKKVQGAAERVRREDEKTMKMPFGLRIVTSSAWADTFRPSLEAHDRLLDVQDNVFVMHPRAAHPP